jgi:hypothetical protein
VAAEEAEATPAAVILGVEEEGTTRTLAAEEAATLAAAAAATAGGAAAAAGTTAAAAAAGASTRSRSPCTALRRRCTTEAEVHPRTRCSAVCSINKSKMNVLSTVILVLENAAVCSCKLIT